MTPSKVYSSIATLALTALATGLTVTDGVVTFGSGDTDKIDQAVSNAVSNLWAGFSFVLPYLGVAVGIFLVIAMFQRLRRGRV